MSVDGKRFLMMFRWPRCKSSLDCSRPGWPVLATSFAPVSITPLDQTVAVPSSRGALFAAVACEEESQ
jgi:hypothetical protein